MTVRRRVVMVTMRRMRYKTLKRSQTAVGNRGKLLYGDGACEEVIVPASIRATDELIWQTIL